MFRGTKFRVHGRVQGVFFRANTRKTAAGLGLKGWVRNVKDGTVQGVAEGDPAKIAEIKHWLEKVGSPQSEIEKCDFEDYSLEEPHFDNFYVAKTARKPSDPHVLEEEDL